MSAELLFETRSINHVLHQQGAVEEAPHLSLRLELSDGPIIYVSDGSAVHPAAWSMVIRRCSVAETAQPVYGTLRYAGGGAKPRCVIDLQQSSERFAALLDMFKGGNPSEITVSVASLADKPDYSKFWNTAQHPSIPIASICFEFPLPQHEA